MKTEIGRAVADMLENCMPKEMIVLAVDMYVLALESTRHSVDETAENRRAWDREYRKNRRKRPPDNDEIHPTSTRLTTSSLGEDKSYPEVVSKKERKKERGCKLPPDWKPKASHYSEGRQLGFNEAAVDEFAKDMRLWSDANSNRAITTKANWDTTFSGWMRRQGKNGNGTSNHRADPVAGRAAAREAQQASAMARGAANRLAERNSSGPGNGMASGSASIADRIPADERPEDAY